MATQRNISFHEGENWKIDFTAHDENGDALPLLSGAIVRFLLKTLNADKDLVVDLLDYSTDDNIDITNGAAGEASIYITIAEQTAKEINANGIYFYEISVIKDSDPIVQAEGRLNVERSLASSEINPLLFQFQLRFPELTMDDNVILIYLADAKRVVDADDSWQDADRTTAIVYLAAHLVQLRKLAAQKAESGGVDTGEVKSISVGDRTVTFATGTTTKTTSSKTGLNATPYGIEYLAMLRRNPVFLKRT